MFADDTAVAAHTINDIQSIVTRFANTASNFGLKLNIHKTKVLVQPSPSQPLDTMPNIKIAGSGSV